MWYASLVCKALYKLWPAEQRSPLMTSFAIRTFHHAHSMPALPLGQYAYKGSRPEYMHNLSTCVYLWDCLLLKSIIFWDVIPCSVVEVYRRFEVTYCIYLQCLRVV
jgi:hypothetical protein